MGIFPNFRGENKTYSKPPPRRLPNTLPKVTLSEFPNQPKSPRFFSIPSSKSERLTLSGVKRFCNKSWKEAKAKCQRLKGNVGMVGHKS